MDEKRFWDIVRAGCRREVDSADWQPRLVAMLKSLEPSEILAFDRLFNEKTAAAYSNDLWGAAYFINGGASDDGFYYFRCWLVGLGKKVYDNALANPDSLADLLPLGNDAVAEAGICAAGYLAWGELGLAREAREKALSESGIGPDGDLKGDDWNFDDEAEVRKRFPRLAAIYISGEDDE